MGKEKGLRLRVVLTWSSGAQLSLLCRSKVLEHRPEPQRCSEPNEQLFRQRLGQAVSYGVGLSVNSLQVILALNDRFASEVPPKVNMRL